MATMSVPQASYFSIEYYDVEIFDYRDPSIMRTGEDIEKLAVGENEVFQSTKERFHSSYDKSRETAIHMNNYWNYEKNILVDNQVIRRMHRVAEKMRSHSMYDGGIAHWEKAIFDYGGNYNTGFTMDATPQYLTTEHGIEDETYELLKRVDGIPEKKGEIII